MLEDESTPHVSKKIEALASVSPFFQRVGRLVRSHPAPFLLGWDREGLDLGVGNHLAGRPNRARCKLFPLAKGRFAVFFYKPSLLPYSRDRFGYGGRVFDPESITDAEVVGWLNFVAEGLPPDRRPANLLRGFPYDVPQ